VIYFPAGAIGSVVAEQIQDRSVFRAVPRRREAVLAVDSVVSKVRQEEHSPTVHGAACRVGEIRGGKAAEVLVVLCQRQTDLPQFLLAPHASRSLLRGAYRRQQQGDQNDQTQRHKECPNGKGFPSHLPRFGHGLHCVFFVLLAPSGYKRGYKLRLPLSLSCFLEADGKGFEHPQKSTRKSGVFQAGGAESGALGAQNAVSDPDLQTIIDAWPNLPEDSKAAILAMVKAATV
jgi:hypothetical protein